MKVLLTIAMTVMLVAAPAGTEAQTKSATPSVHKTTTSVAKASLPAMPRYPV